MRCRNHYFFDATSDHGVCASCLRECLFAVIHARVQEAQLLLHSQTPDDPRNSDATQLHIVFSQSISPYISDRESDNAAELPELQHTLSEQRFFSTPQAGPNGVIITESLYKRRNGKFWKLSNLFRSKMQNFDMDPNFESKSRKSNSATSTKTSTWFSSVFSSKQKKKSRMNGMISFTCVGKTDERTRRGMSPTTELDNECGDGWSEYSSGSPQGWKETPQRKTPQAHIGRRRQNQPKNVAGLVFCLSPLVRPSPNQNRNQKGIQPENTLPSGEIAKPGLGGAAAFPCNKSRKLANFGKFHPSY